MDMITYDSKGFPLDVASQSREFSIEPSIDASRASNRSVIECATPNVRRRGFEPRFPRWLPSGADDGSTIGVCNTLPVVNRRGSSGSAPYQADLATENPTH